jgi:signal transduction histidine kinase
MTLDPRQIHAQRYPRIGGIIGRSMETIVLEWWRRCRGDQPDVSDAPAEDFCVRARGFLRSLAHQLESTDPAAWLPRRRATGLGELRWEQGADISQVVRDYQTLRLVLLEHLDRELDTPVTRDESMALSLNIDEAINAAVTTFAQQEAAARDDYEHELEQSNQELRRFAHVVAHELKSPLNTQALSMRLLQLQVGKDHFDEKASQTLQRATESVAQMTSLINELLRYAEIEHEEESELRPTSCDEALTQALENLTIEINRSGAEIQYGQLPVVMAKRTGLVLLLQNLIGNAVHYRGNRRPRIRIEATDTDEGWLLRVIDNGAGIRPEDQTRIFQMFERAHRELRPRGTGIGLGMCRRIMEDFGGRIWVESQPGVGSTFFFTLRKVGTVEQPAEAERRAIPA